MTSAGLWKGSIFRLKDSYLCDAYQKCKILMTTSENCFNFISPILPTLIPKCDSILRGNNFITMNLAMLQPPRN